MSSAMKKTNRLTNDSNRSWSKCEVCANNELVFESAAQFGQHLRDRHSTREGGSYVCRYGANNICSSLPLEGVSDRDYELHIAKCHIFPPKLKPRQTLGITGVTSNNYENGTKVSINNSNNTIHDNQIQRHHKRTSFPMPSNNELFETNSYLFGNSSESKPNVISDSISKWNVYSSSQNLASVLNDPSKPRSYSETIFTKDWGIYFVDSGHVPHSPFYPKISHSHFESYIKKVLKRARKQRMRHRSESISLQTHSQSRSAESFVPKIFFNTEFNLENIETFKTVLSFCTNKEVLQTCPSSPTKWNPIAKEAMKELQRNFSEYLDIVEENLAREISLRFKNFFHVMTTMDTVMDQLKRTIKEVTHLRKKCGQLESSLIKPSLKNIQLSKARNNAKDVFNKINLMATVHQTQPTIQLLLSTLDFVGALDLISTSQEVVAQELSGVHSFRHLKLQLVEIEKVIDQMMKEEFVKYLTAEWNRPLDQNNENYLTDEDKLLSIVYGMLRLQQFNFIETFRDEANTAIKAVVKQTVIETLSSEDNIEVGQRVDGSLFDQLRLIEFSKWIVLLQRVFDNLLICLKRIYAVYKVMSNGFAAIADRNDKRSLEFDSTIADGSVDAIKMLLENDYIELSANLKETLCTICDFAHSRCAHVVESRAKDGALDKLTAADFLQLNKCIEEFTEKCLEICGRRSPNLKLVLQTQANKFATRFHEERKKKLNSLLDIEQWKSVNSVSHEFQDLVKQLTENNIQFSNIRQLKVNGNSDQKLKSYVLVKGEKFVVVNSAITLVSMIIEYCECAHEIRTLSPDLLTRLLDLLKLFNSRTSQLVLGAGALQVAGLKTITARTLIISSRCLKFVIIFMPIAKSHFESLLNPKQQSMCKHFDEIIRSYNEHITKIPEKVVAVVREIADSQLSKWVAKAPVPSPQFQAISQHLMRLHDNIQDSLPISDLVELFKQIHNTFKEVLRIHLERLQIKNDGGILHGLVTQELTFYAQNLRKLSIGKYLNFSSDDLWDK